MNRKGPAVSDFRSDTVTLPTEEMRRSVFAAELGDDVLGGDPTVERLQQMAAELTGKEAALFVASGTMANLLAVTSHCRAGDEVILGEGSHIFNNEGGGSARIGGVQLRTLPDPDGCFDPERIAAAVRRPDLHHPRTRLICTEDTHNGAGGVVVPLERLWRIRQVASEHELPVHLDGARIFHAAVASAVPVREIAATADTVSFCLSKGLCCPAGSLLCGPRDLVEQARRLRKVLGGGMRQVGFLAAPGIVALEKMIDRLAADHRRARRLAESLAELPGLELDLARVQTNIVYLTVTGLPVSRLVEALRREGVACLVLGQKLRLVTHHDIGDDDVERAVAAFRKVLA
ncbi:MAG: aminotransferase class I/II-fold pyridoxal phosphate-dependent enzyme [Deltaproteobacteria bacterium]|nr:aminotransferase class I/II-fold pyridoxal phosphate-dependent enzyme [Deltaproteobacteria bacterium]